jgi:D-alanine-D-alanine ligase
LIGSDLDILITVSQEETDRTDMTDARRCAQRVADAVCRLGSHADVLGVTKAMLSDQATLVDVLRATDVDCVFNLFEGFADDAAAEAVFARILEHSGLRHTGNPSATLDLCLDKARAKDLLRTRGVPVAWSRDVRSASDIDVLQNTDVPFPVFVKACAEDASIGIDLTSKVDDTTTLSKVLQKKLAELPRGLLVEEFLPGREFNVGMIGEPPYERVGVGVIDYAKYVGCAPFLTYAAKWDPLDPAYYAIVPDVEMPLDDALLDRLTAIAQTAGAALGCRSYFRVDMREKDGALFVIDVNPNPDINEDAGFMRQARARGWGFEDVIGKIIGI